MRLPRFRFTIGQLVAMIGIVAMLCFLLTTTLWPMALMIAIVSPGFAFDRTRGGPGILGAMLAGLLGFSGIGVAFYAYFHLQGDAGALGHAGPGAWLTYFGLGGLACGTLFGLCTWSALFLRDRLNRSLSPRIESRAPAIRHGQEDRGLQHPRAGGHRP